MRLVHRHAKRSVALLDEPSSLAKTSRIKGLNVKAVITRVTRDKQLRKHLGASKNKGTPKWMVYNGKPY